VSPPVNPLEHGAAPPERPGRRAPVPRGDQVARAVVRAAVGRWGEGNVTVLEDGRPRPVAGPEPGGGGVVVTVHDPRAYRYLLRHGSVGLGRSYAAGWWDADDLVELVRLLTRRLPTASGPGDALAALRARRGGRVQAVDPARDRRDVQAHYDLGNAFFELFLDPTLTYSCAIFDPPTATLEEASVAKLDRICRKLELSPDDHVLEIGTGWGSFALHAASRYGCRVTTTTISDRQLAYASRRVAESGLGRLVTVCGDHYRDLDGRFDKLVSIEMIEAVDWPHHREFFQRCAALVRPGGLMALQAIVIDDRLFERAKRSEDFIKDMVFPGSCIPSVASIVSSVASATDFRMVGLEDIGMHYAETLARWRERFRANRAEISALGYDRSFLRTWDLYLAYCRAGFLEQRISDVQILLAKPGWRPAGAPGAPR